MASAPLAKPPQTPDELPAEIFHMIMSHFEQKELWRMLVVSRQWRALLEGNKAYWQRFDTSMFKDAQWPNAARWILELSDYSIKTARFAIGDYWLGIPDSSEIGLVRETKWQFIRIIKQCSRLESLHVRGYLVTRLGEIARPEILRVLKVAGCMETLVPRTILARFPNLEEFRLFECYFGQLDDGTCWSHDHTAIQLLKVHIAHDDDAEELDSVCLEDLAVAAPNLTMLELDLFRLPQNPVSLSGMLALRELKLERIVGWARLPMPLPPGSIERLTVRMLGRQFFNESMGNTQVPAIPNVKELEINFDGTDDLHHTHSFWYGVIEGSNCRLESLKVDCGRDYRGDFDDDWGDIDSEEGQERRNTWVSRLLINLATARYLENLKVLHVRASGDKYLHDQVGWALAMHCPELVELRWDGPCGLSGRTVCDLVSKKGKRLEQLYLSNGGLDIPYESSIAKVDW